MAAPLTTHSFLSHSLFIRDPRTSLAFYQHALGMAVLHECNTPLGTHYFLGYPHRANEEQGIAKGMLELIHRSQPQHLDIRQQPDLSEGYWKFSISVADVDLAHAFLTNRGLTVGAPFQVPDVADLCHLEDPDGYCIELIQHDFQHNHTPSLLPFEDAPGTPATFSLSTFRIKDPIPSLRFYEGTLGMQLLSRQPVPSRKMTLYFLAYTDEVPPHEDLEAIGNREWLWKRPYTQIELQHIWGTEQQESFRYRVGEEPGFGGISLLIQNGAWDDLKTTLTASENKPFASTHALYPDTQVITLHDPDGYNVKLIDAGDPGNISTLRGYTTAKTR